MLVLLTLLSRLPLPFLYALADVLALIASRLYRRRVVRENLRQSFPELSEEEISRVSKKFYFRLGSFFAETVKAMTISESEMKRRVVFLNSEIADETRAEHGTLLVFAAHQINWEWMALASPFYFSFPSAIVYQPLSSQSADRLMLHLRSRFGNKLIKRDGSVRKILRGGQGARAIGVVADQLPRPYEDKLWVHFLHRETSFSKGITQLPFITQARAVFPRVKAKKRGYYEVEFCEIGRPPYAKGDLQVLRNYTAELEKLIRAAPENWLWSHRRWKYTRAENEDLIIL